MAINKNIIVSEFSDYSSSDEFYVGPEHLSPSSGKSWTRQHERKGELDKEKSDAALAKIFDDLLFPFFSIGSIHLPALRA